MRAADQQEARDVLQSKEVRKLEMTYKKQHKAIMSQASQRLLGPKRAKKLFMRLQDRELLSELDQLKKDRDRERRENYRVAMQERDDKIKKAKAAKKIYARHAAGKGAPSKAKVKHLRRLSQSQPGMLSPQPQRRQLNQCVAEEGLIAEPPPFRWPIPPGLLRERAVAARSLLPPS